MKKIFKKRRSSHGVALLFALGILSLLLILGLAFVSNALLAQKAASNNSNRALAKMLAQSAISRVATSLMVYQHALLVDNDLDELPKDFSSICSYSEDVSGDDNTIKNLQDQLQFSTRSLTNQYSKLAYPGNVLGYEPTNSEARWELIYDDYSEAEDKRKIIGRIAFQVLPPTSNSRLNLAHSLKGAATRTALSPQDPLRLGRDINEINIEYARSFGNSTTSNPILKDILDPTSLPEYYEELYTAYGADIFKEDIDNRKEWIERWFGEGENPVESEAYRFKDNSSEGFAYRFNLAADLTNFYPSSNSANSNDRVEALSGDSKDFNERADNLPTNYGIPFLRKIGNDKGSFENRESFRKQIIANLNDYCDTDNVPTSDTAASTWKNLPTTVTYTGNEKTPYINEVGFGVKLFPIQENGGVYENSLVLKTAVIPELIVELIDIYGSPGRNYTYHGSLEKLQFEMTMSLAGTIIYDQNNGTAITEKKHPFIQDFDSDLLSFSLTTTPRTITINFADPTRAKDFSKGYQIGSAPILDAGTNYQTVSSKDVFSTIKGLMPTAPDGSTNTFKEIQIKAVRYQIKSFKFALGAMALTDNNNSDSGVDFVRRPFTPQDINVKYSDNINFTFTPFANLANAADLTGDDISVTKAAGYLPLTQDAASDGSSVSSIFYVGGVEAVDPRQNLNVDVDQTDPYKTDWIYNPQIADFKNSEKALSMTVVEGNTLLNNLTQGLRNSVTSARPDSTTLTDYTSPFDSIKLTSTGFDEEEVDDPAWVNDADHLSTAVISNHPMQSLWELGAIHRAAPWQTINLKKAGSPSKANYPIQPEDHTLKADTNWEAAGVSYKVGDGGLLDEVAISPNNKARNYGRVDVNMLWENDPQRDKDNADKMRDYDHDMAGALFINLRYNQNLTDFNNGNKPSVSSGAGLEINDSNRDIWATAIGRLMSSSGLSSSDQDKDRLFESRAQFIDWEINDGSIHSLKNAFGLISPSDLKNDASQEEIIGKTVNLLSASTGTLPNVVQVLIVAQTIRDIDGRNIVKLRYDGEALDKECKFGTLDIRQDKSSNIPESVAPYIYFDEITGECKIIVTLDRNPTTGRMMVRRIDYLD